MDSSGEELQPVGASSAADAGPPPGESDGPAAAGAPEPQPAPATPCEAPAASAAPAAQPHEAGQDGRKTERAARDAPAGADDSDDRDAETPADFFGFFVDVHKGLVTELKEEFQRIPESSTKICKRLGLPICAQMRAAVKPTPREPQTEAAEMTP